MYYYLVIIVLIQYVLQFVKKTADIARMYYNEILRKATNENAITHFLRSCLIYGPDQSGPGEFFLEPLST